MSAGLRSAWWLIVAVVWPAVAGAQALPPTRVTIPKVLAAPTLDDYLPGASMPGLKVTDFRQREPKDLEAPTQPTAAYLSYDASHVYVAFVCRQPRGDIRARMQKREDIGSDDVVGVYLDTFHDRQRAYFFFSTPLGIQEDGIITEAFGDDSSFDTQWESRGTLTDDGYVVLIAVPFKSLRFPVRDGAGSQEWGLALVREIRSNNETDYWPGSTQRVSGLIAQFATADGIADVSPGRNIQILPYGTFTGARLLDADTAAYVRENEGRVGVDVKLVPRDAVTLDFTINPDFSQVESDEPQVTVNQRFEVFFPEKRPFFLENSDFFNSPLTLFFSRRVRDPQFGARMTGKYGKWATGALVIDDRAPGREADPASPEFEDRAVNVVGSLRRDFANQSNLGFMATSRTFAGAGNQVAGASTHLRLDSNWFLDAQAVGSHDTDLAGARHDGAATFLGLVRDGRSFNYSLAYSGVSPEFRAPLGFVRRTDIHDASSVMGYRWHPTSGPLTSWGPDSSVQGIWNYSGDLQDWTVSFPVEFEFKRRVELSYRHSLASEKIDGLGLDQREDQIELEWETFRWLSVDASVQAGTRPNYDPAEGMAPFLGDFQDWEIEVTLKPISRLSIDETFLWSRLDGRPGTPAAGADIFENRIVRTRVNYQFTREWSLRAILDYNSVASNRSVVDLEAGRQFGADILLTWLAHPGTALYIGYTDGYDSTAVDPTRRELTPDGALRSTGRQLFVKTSWLFRF